MKPRDFFEVKNESANYLLVIIENAKLINKFNKLGLIHYGIDDLRNMQKACNDLVNHFEKEVLPFMPKTKESKLTQDK